MKAIAEIIGSTGNIILDGRKSEGGVRFTWTIEKMPYGVSPIPAFASDAIPHGYLEVPGSMVTKANLPSPGDYEFKLTVWGETPEGKDPIIESDSITIKYSY